MTVRILLGALAAATLVLSTGCFGPINNRLYVSEWKGKRAHPIKVYTDYVYPGESYEHHVLVEGEVVQED